MFSSCSLNPSIVLENGICASENVKIESLRAGS